MLRMLSDCIWFMLSNLVSHYPPIYTKRRISLPREDVIPAVYIKQAGRETYHPNPKPKVMYGQRQHNFAVIARATKVSLCFRNKCVSFLRPRSNHLTPL